jgi:hypothetical protein
MSLRASFVTDRVRLDDQATRTLGQTTNSEGRRESRTESGVVGTRAGALPRFPITIFNSPKALHESACRGADEFGV